MVLPIIRHPKLISRLGYRLDRKDELPIPPVKTGLQAWYRGDIGVTLESGVVSEWQDISGNGNHATQATPANRPTFIANGFQNKDTIEFDGSAQFLSANSLAPIFSGSDKPYTVFIAFTADSLPAFIGALFGSGSSLSTIPNINIGISALSTTFGRLRCLRRDDLNVSAPEARSNELTGETFFVTIRFEGIQKDFYLNDVQDTQNNPHDVGALTVDLCSIGASNSSSGPSNFFDGLISEIIIYDFSLSDAQVDTVNNYLNLRYSPPSLIGGRFNFNRVSGLQAWYRADVGVTMGVSGVSAWADQSNNGNHATQLNAARQPLFSPILFNGLPSIVFSVTGMSLEANTVAPSFSYEDAPFTITFAIEQFQNQVGSRAMVGFGDSGSASNFFTVGKEGGSHLETIRNKTGESDDVVGTATIIDKAHLIITFRADANLINIQSSPTGLVRTANVVTVTFNSNHSFAIGNKIIIRNTNLATGITPFNGKFTVLAVPTATTITYAQVAENATGGAGTCHGNTKLSTFINNVIDSSSVAFENGLSNLNLFTIGALIRGAQPPSRRYDCNISEIVLWDRALTESERQFVEEEVNDAWNLTVYP